MRRPSRDPNLLYRHGSDAFRVRSCSYGIGSKDPEILAIALQWRVPRVVKALRVLAKLEPAFWTQQHWEEYG
jgi:hypothetical protein